MGAEAACRLTVGRHKTDGKLLLETDTLMFRGGGVRLAIPYKEMSSVTVRDGALRVEWPEGTAAFQIGDAAAKWAEKIRNPPSRADKLGIKSGQRIVIAGVEDEALAGEIAARGAALLTRDAGDADIVFFGAATSAGLAAKLRAVKARIKPAGAIWIVRPKGHPAVSEADVMKAGKDAGLVDVKVARFSDTHTAEKFVIPVAARGASSPARTRRRSR